MLIPEETKPEEEASEPEETKPEEEASEPEEAKSEKESLEATNTTDIAFARLLQQAKETQSRIQKLPKQQTPAKTSHPDDI